MNPAALRHFWTVLWPLSRPVIVLYGLAVAYWIYQAGDDWPANLAMDPLWDYRFQLVAITTDIGIPVGFAWSLLGGQYARLVLSAAQLCIPGLTRALHISLLVLAAATIGGATLLGLGLNSPLLPVLAVCSDAILLGLLLSLLPRFAWIIAMVGLQFPVVSMLSPRSEAPPFLPVAWSLAALLALGWVFRLRALIGSARAGASNSSLRSLLSLPVSSSGIWQGRAAPFGMRLLSSARQVLRSISLGLLYRDHPSGRRADDRSPDGTIRLILGPRYCVSALLWAPSLSLACAAFPWCFWLIWGRDFEGRVYDDWLTRVRSLTYVWAFLAVGFTGGAMTRLVNRLSELFRTPGGEISELALLPGFGSQDRLRAALVRQALLRPALWFGLGLSLAVGGSVLGRLLLAGSLRDGLPKELLLILPVLSVLLCGATTGLGVLEGLFDKGGAWRATLLPGMITFLAIGSAQLEPFYAAGSMLTAVPPVWLWVAWALVLACLAATLLGLMIRWNRRRNILYRSF